MKTRSLAILAVCAAVSVAAAAFAVARAPSFDRMDVVGQPVFPGLLDKINDVYGMKIEQHREVLTFTRGDDGWTLDEAGGFPARDDEIAKTILGVAELGLLEPKTKDPDRYARLQLDDPENDGSLAQRVTLTGKDGAEIAKVIVGKGNYVLPETAAGGVYVRLPGEERTWLAKGMVDLDSSVRDWLQRRIIKLDSDRVRRVAVTHGDGSVVEITRPNAETEAFQLTDVPADKTGRTANMDALAGVMFGILLNDVKRRDLAPDLTGAHVVEARYETFDGLTLDAWVAEKDGKTWMRLTLAADDTADAAVKKEVEDLRAKTEPWLYEIPDYQGDILRRGMADMIKDAGPSS